MKFLIPCILGIPVRLVVSRFYVICDGGGSQVVDFFCLTLPGFRHLLSLRPPPLDCFLAHGKQHKILVLNSYLSLGFQFFFFFFAALVYDNHF